jgi:serine/threonine protein kinase
LVEVVRRRADDCDQNDHFFNRYFNLRHSIPFGCFFPVESSRWLEFKTVRLYATEGSLADNLLNPPGWWTPTMKAKAVVGIIFGLWFAHGLRLLHGTVKASNILFDADRRIQIADFSPTGADDVCAFAALLLEIAVGGPASPPLGAAGHSSLPPVFPVCFASDRGGVRA